MTVRDSTNIPTTTPITRAIRSRRSTEHQIVRFMISSPLPVPLFDRGGGFLINVNEAANSRWEPEPRFQRAQLLVPRHARSATALEYRWVLIAFDDQKASQPTLEP